MCVNVFVLCHTVEDDSPFFLKALDVFNYFLNFFFGKKDVTKM